MSDEPRRRPILRLPGNPRDVLKGVRAQPQEPPEQRETVPAASEAVWSPKTRISDGYHARKRAELAEILGIAIDELPSILRGRTPAPLKIGIRDDLIARYPAADPIAVGRWLAGWTNSEQYHRRTAVGGNRFDLDGCTAGEVSAEAAELARMKLAHRARKANQRADGQE